MDIKKVIWSKGFTLDFVASGMGITTGALSGALVRNPTLNKLKEISRVTGIPVSELVKEDDETRQEVTCTCPHCGGSIKITIEKA